MTHPLPGAEPCCGFLNVLKPPGMTSSQVVGRVRWLLGGTKVGHAGTLDPEAAGVLPLMVGKAARLFDYLQDKEKAYVAEVAFGTETDTQDAQGTVTAEGNAYPDEAAIRAALPTLTGALLQTPPMFSALKRDGRRLYELARRGEAVALEPRPVTVHALTFLGLMPRQGARLEVRCSKGFYVRTLCQDLGRAVGCPAHMRFLLRTRSGPFTLEQAYTLEELQAAAEGGTLTSCFAGMETALTHLPVLDVPPTLLKNLRNGIPLPVRAVPGATTFAEGQPVQLRGNGILLAIGSREGELLYQRTWLEEA